MLTQKMKQKRSRLSLCTPLKEANGWRGGKPFAISMIGEDGWSTSRSGRVTRRETVSTATGYKSDCISEPIMRNYGEEKMLSLPEIESQPFIL
jgi:hypothetical protein